jgi:4-amino-4-deoxy-L-arabinose transferase-like glycosyltransferase
MGGMSLTTNSTTASTGSFQRVLYHPLFIPVCIAIGLTIRISVALLTPIEPVSDAAWYLARARELLSGMGYQEGGHPTAYWPIGWPAIMAGSLAIFGSQPVAILAINTVSAALIMWLIIWFARELTHNEWVARVALLAYVFYPNHIAYHGAANSETAYAALSMLAFILLIKGRKKVWLLAICGFIFGVATLVKPQTIAFPLGAIIALGIVYPAYRWKQALQAGVVVYLMLLLVVLPWSARNYAVLGEFVLVSTNGGTALLLGANNQITGDHFDYQHTPVFKQLGIPWEQRVERQVELNQRQKEVAKDWIADNTGEWLAWMPKKAFNLWIKDTDGFWSFDRQYPTATVAVRASQVINQLYYAVILILSAICAVLVAKAILRRESPLMRAGLLFCMPVFVTLLAAVFTGQIRYHHAAMPYLMICSSIALLRMAQSNKIKKLPIKLNTHNYP